MFIRQNNCAGFSMVEVLIVIAIVGILATFSISYLYGSRAQAQLERAEVQVTNVLKEARSKAVSEEVNTRVVFSEDANSMVTEAQSNIDGTWSQVGATENLAEGIVFVAGSNTLADSTASFTPRGTLVSGGEFTIAREHAAMDITIKTQYLFMRSPHSSCIFV